MPLIGCRRKFIQNTLDKGAVDIRNLQKVKILNQQTATAQPINQQHIQREKEQAFQTYPRSEREIAESVNWSGEDSCQMVNQNSESGLIYYPSQMIQEEIYYQWPCFKIMQDEYSKETERTDGSSKGATQNLV